MSDQPTVAQKSPYIVSLAPGTYYWCACGRSSKQPLCDGSHKGTAFSPVPFTVTSKAPLVLCGCKHSKDMPYCDGSHNSL